MRGVSGWALLALAALAATAAAAAGGGHDGTSALTAPLTAAEREQLVRDFCDFVQVMTESEDAAPPDRVPSTEGQRDFNNMIRGRLQWPHVVVDDLGCLHAVIEGKPGAPAIAMLAHVDTVLRCSSSVICVYIHTEPTVHGQGRRACGAPRLGRGANHAAAGRFDAGSQRHAGAPACCRAQRHNHHGERRHAPRGRRQVRCGASDGCRSPPPEPAAGTTRV